MCRRRASWTRWMRCWAPRRQRRRRPMPLLSPQPLSSKQRAGTGGTAQQDGRPTRCASVAWRCEPLGSRLQAAPAARRGARWLPPCRAPMLPCTCRWFVVTRCLTACLPACSQELGVHTWTASASLVTRCSWLSARCAADRGCRTWLRTFWHGEGECGTSLEAWPDEGAGLRPC